MSPNSNNTSWEPVPHKNLQPLMVNSNGEITVSKRFVIDFVYKRLFQSIEVDISRLLRWQPPSMRVHERHTASIPKVTKWPGFNRLKRALIGVLKAPGLFPKQANLSDNRNFCLSVNTLASFRPTDFRNRCYFIPYSGTWLRQVFVLINFKIVQCYLSLV